MPPCATERFEWSEPLSCLRVETRTHTPHACPHVHVSASSLAFSMSRCALTCSIHASARSPCLLGCARAHTLALSMSLQTRSCSACLCVTLRVRSRSLHVTLCVLARAPSHSPFLWTLARLRSLLMIMSLHTLLARTLSLSIQYVVTMSHGPPACAARARAGRSAYVLSYVHSKIRDTIRYFTKKDIISYSYHTDTRIILVSVSYIL